MIYQTEKKTITIGEFEISLLSISNVDELYAHLVSKGDEHEDVKDERIPYWADLWPSALGLAQFLVQSRIIKRGITVHEMGCGLGLPGIIAGKFGAEVLFSDYLTEVLGFTEQNWNLNLTAKASFKKMDWRHPDLNTKAEVLLASDVAYEKRSFEFLPKAFKSLVFPCGKILVSEPNRLYAQEFFDSLRFHGFNVAKHNMTVSMNGISNSINVFEIDLRP